MCSTFHSNTSAACFKEEQLQSKYKQKQMHVRLNVFVPGMWQNQWSRSVRCWLCASNTKPQSLESSEAEFWVRQKDFNHGLHTQLKAFLLTPKGHWKVERLQRKNVRILNKPKLIIISALTYTQVHWLEAWIVHSIQHELLYMHSQIILQGCYYHHLILAETGTSSLTFIFGVDNQTAPLWDHTFFLCE